jgi:hypothetical protein
MLHGPLSFGSIGLPGLRYGVLTRNAAAALTARSCYKFRPNVMAVTRF